MNSRWSDRCGWPSFIPPFSLMSGGSGPRRGSAITRLYSADMSYRVREATLDDADALVHHRVGMFTDMGVTFDAAALAHAFHAWLSDTMPAGTYRAWLVESEDGAISLHEEECMGACEKAPCVAIDYAYHDEVTPELMARLIESLRAGEVPAPSRGPAMRDFRHASRVLAGVEDSA